METLLRLSDSGHYQSAFEAFKLPMSKCPDVLVLALLQTTVSALFFSPWAVELAKSCHCCCKNNALIFKWDLYVAFVADECILAKSLCYDVCAAHMEYTEAGAHLKPDGHLPRQSPQLRGCSALRLAPPGTFGSIHVERE